MLIEPNNIYNGNCLELMKSIPDNSIDAIVTDPPYELGFMGKSWDKSGIANNVEMWKEALRVLKPGGHLLAFGGTRTYHRMASAIEDAGFEVRDMIEWVYGSGFPKSLDIAKQIDKLKGEKGIYNITDNEMELSKYYSEKLTQRKYIRKDRQTSNPILYNAKLEEAKQWEGWGTALKPAHEPICMARKPISEKTVAENCLKWGTGGINIDESRVGTEEIRRDNYKSVGSHGAISRTGEGSHAGEEYTTTYGTGRFPANLIHDNSEEVRECFPETRERIILKQGGDFSFSVGDTKGKRTQSQIEGNSGNASRFFKSIIYIPKASKSDRNRHCEGLEEKQYSYDGRQKEIENPFQRNNSVATNNHPTVKPTALMEYLINMITREGQIILDPFLGSGTTAIACINTNRQYIGIELDEGYFKIANNRINNALESNTNLFNNKDK